MESKTASGRRILNPEQKSDRQGPFTSNVGPRYWRGVAGESFGKLAIAPGMVGKNSANRFYDVRMGNPVMEKVLSVTSKAFRRSSRFPRRYTSEGENFNPPLDISGVPQGTVSLALLLEKHQPAVKDSQVHWLAWNIPVIGHIRENDVPGCQGINDFGTMFYRGPQPEPRPQAYTFRVFALDSLLYLPLGARKQAFLEAIEGHIVAYGEFAGVCQKR